MSTPWTVAPSQARATISRAHDRIVGDRDAGPDAELGAGAPGIRPLVVASWRRSLDLHLDPDSALARLALTEDDLRAYREGHRLNRVLPVIQRLVVRHSYDAGLIVAVGDEAGRLLWIDGDRELKRRAEAMLFVEGADWSEHGVGTSAPGTALALDHGIQITRAEHFTRAVHPWSCTAVPVHDPVDGGVIGVIDITGGDDAVAPVTLPLLEATVAAVEAELRIQRLDETRSRRRTPPPAPAVPTLRVLGRDGGQLRAGSRTDELSLRHAEILALLAWHRGGLPAERLASLLYGRDGSEVTLRAEMFRLRRALPPELAPLSRPYRLPLPLETDLHRVLAFLQRGAHKVALGAYDGPLLPASDAPGIVELRDEVRGRLREALLAEASADTLFEYAKSDDGAYDAEVWRTLLAVLPPRSPKRAQAGAGGGEDRADRAGTRLGVLPREVVNAG